MLPVVHGSAVLSSGESQTLATLTVGSPLDKQTTFTLAGPTHERFMLQASTPAFAGNTVCTLTSPDRSDDSGLADMNFELAPEHAFMHGCC